MKNGIDVSSAQGVINWTQVAQDNIEFAIIHINSGSSQSVESRFLYNATECERVGIPYGAYWFCYDLTPQDAYNSGVAGARILLDNNLNYTYPLYYDVERTGYYDYRAGSVENWINNGITPTPAFAKSMIEAFASGAQSQGVPVGLYFNWGMWSEFDYGSLLPNHPDWSRWIAQWSTPPSPPSFSTWDIWQYSETGIVSGISGSVDLDYMDDGYTPPVPPGPSPTPLRTLPIWMYLKFPF